MQRIWLWLPFLEKRRGDSVAIPGNEKAALSERLFYFCCYYSILLGCGGKI
jgi:hypothetical protein